MKLYFEKEDKRSLIAEPGDLEEAKFRIEEFCAERNWPVFITRTLAKGGETIFDVGSHTQFFIMGE